jgi:hypothetical protein
MRTLDGATWLQADPAARCLEIAATAPVDDSFMGDRIDQDGAPEFLEKLRLGEAQLLSQSRFDTYEPAVRAWLGGLPASDIIIVPVCPEGCLAAALAVDNRSGTARTLEADRALLQGIAGVAALALRAEGQPRREYATHGDPDWLAALGGLASCLVKDLAAPVRGLRSAFGAADPGLLASLDDVHAAVETISVLGRGPGRSVARHPCDLGQEVDFVCSQLAEQARSQGVDVDLVLDHGAPKVRMLPEAFRQLVRLLLQCSLYHLPAGGRVQVSVACAASGSRSGVALELRDDRGGVEVEELEDISLPTTPGTASVSFTSNHLSACQYLVSALQGELEVSSEPGDGTRVCAWFAVAGSESSRSTEAERVS